MARARGRRAGGWGRWEAGGGLGRRVEKWRACPACTPFDALPRSLQSLREARPRTLLEAARSAARAVQLVRRRARGARALHASCRSVRSAAKSTEGTSKPASINTAECRPRRASTHRAAVILRCCCLEWRVLTAARHCTAQQPSCAAAAAAARCFTGSVNSSGCSSGASRSITCLNGGRAAASAAQHAVRSSRSSGRHVSRSSGRAFAFAACAAHACGLMLVRGPPLTAGRAPGLRNRRRACQGLESKA